MAMALLLSMYIMGSSMVVSSILIPNDRPPTDIQPLNMSINDIPMMLTITFDDALHDFAHEKTSKLLQHQNRNGYQIPLVFYISNTYSDYSIIQKRYLEGSEIAIHTVTHTTSTGSNMTKWYYEITKSREFISLHSNIPINNINGFRAPFLAKTDSMFKILNYNQFLYDSTITETGHQRCC